VISSEDGNSFVHAFFLEPEGLSFDVPAMLAICISKAADARMVCVVKIGGDLPEVD
tara:strand:- start:18616 stop:18783 length:168 start_codon:yes stop_codon:yes gene_type:complete